MADLPLSTVVRLAKTKGGVERVGDDGGKALVAAAEKYIEKLAKKAGELAKHAGRKTVGAEDVQMAAKEL